MAQKPRAGPGRLRPEAGRDVEEGMSACHCTGNEHEIADWQVLAYVEEPRYGRVWRIDERRLADGSRETRKVNVTGERR